jgi:hypothetical protein
LRARDRLRAGETDVSGRIVVLLVSSALLVACSQPPAARPRDGAPVTVVGKTTRIDLGSIVPPTLLPAVAPTATPAPSTPSTSVPSPMMPTHIITASGGTAVNMRESPSTASPVITTLREGTLVEALGDPISAEGRQWQEVRAGDRNGWVIAVVVHRQ